MKLVMFMLILTSSVLALNIEERPSSYKDNVISIKSKKHQLEIDRETGLDGKVRSIRLDNNNDDNDGVFGVRVYGIPKNKEIDARKMEKSDPKPVLRGDPRSNNNNSRVENDDKIDGKIERVQIEEPKKVLLKVLKRSVETVGSRYLELEDLEGAEGKVFRPLFVYRQQVNRRKAQKQKKKTYPKKFDPTMSPKSRPIYYHPNRI